MLVWCTIFPTKVQINVDVEGSVVAKCGLIFFVIDVAVVHLPTDMLFDWSSMINFAVSNNSVIIQKKILRPCQNIPVKNKWKHLAECWM